MKYESIKEGDVLYDVRSRKLGNTTMRGQCVYKVRIVSLIPPRTALVSWNQNPPVNWTGRSLEKLRRHPPEWIKGGIWGRNCHFCSSKEKDGHQETCQHPKAIRARKLKR